MILKKSSVSSMAIRILVRTFYKLLPTTCEPIICSNITLYGYILTTGANTKLLIPIILSFVTVCLLGLTS